MITCYINKQLCYPASQSNVKITLQNPFVKDGDEKTMEVVFPMSIPENRLIFGAVNRLDTHFSLPDYDDVRLLADGVEVISGKGTVTSVTATEVKLQILSGKSYLRYKASFTRVFIDKLYYGDLEPRHQHFKGNYPKSKSVFDMRSELNSQGYIGEPGKYAYLPIHDETNDLYVNMPTYLTDDTNQLVGVTAHFKAVQPNLMHVMRVVMEALGYQLESNYFDREPWNRLYIANAKITNVLARALPHWSAYKFLDEFRKLFNAVYVFDDNFGKVNIMPFAESANSEIVEIETVDDFSTHFDEDGLEYLGSSNIEYEMSDYHDVQDTFSQDILKAFNFIECNSGQELEEIFQGMTEQQKMTTIFHYPYGYVYCRRTGEEGNYSYILSSLGRLGPLVRKQEGSTISLSLCPVAVKFQEAHCYVVEVDNEGLAFHFPGYALLGRQDYSYISLLASVDTDYDPSENGGHWNSGIETEPSSELDYTTVQDVIENGESIPSQEEDESLMEVFFASGKMYSSQCQVIESISDFPYKISNVDQPLAFIDYYALSVYGMPRWSMSLQMDPYAAAFIGQFHNEGVKLNRNVNGNNEITVQFRFSGKPDPRKIYMFRNRKFVCSKIEMNVNENGIDPIKTGYFYEMLT